MLELPVADITLNAEQEQAVQMARWLVEKPGRIGVLNGAAGTGKTTCLRTILEEIGPSVMVAPTNRAARRAADVTGKPAQTVHAYVYEPKVQPDGTVVFWRKPSFKLERPTSRVIVCDESSMVGPAVWQDLWAAVQDVDASLLIVGDAFQLPPVAPEHQPFSLFDESFARICRDADIELDRVDLTRVWRQALESPVLRAATSLREHPDDWAHACQVIEGIPACRRVAERVAGMRDDGIDHVAISYTNDVRRQINRQVRKLAGLDDNADPVPGEPLLVRKTNKKAGLFNGQVIEFPGYWQAPFKLPPQYRGVRFGDIACLIDINVLLDGLQADPNQTRGLPFQYVDVNFGYAVTCHAAQGCEYDHVIVQWENTIVRVMPVNMRIRWVYTALTRAKKKVWIGGLP